MYGTYAGWLQVSTPPFVRIHSGNHSKILFLCICICYEIKIISKLIVICCAPPFKLQRTAVCICYEKLIPKSFSSASVSATKRIQEQHDCEGIARWTGEHRDAKLSQRAKGFFDGGGALTLSVRDRIATDRQFSLGSVKPKVRQGKETPTQTCCWGYLRVGWGLPREGVY